MANQIDIGSLATLAGTASPFIYAVLNFAKFLKAKQWNGVVTLVSAWGGGIATSLLFAASDFAASLGIKDLNTASLIIAGISLGSLASAGHDGLKALDNSQSAVVPTLLNPTQDAGQRPSA